MFKILRKIVFFLLIVLVLIGLSLFAYQKGWLKKHPLKNTKIDLQSFKIKKDDGKIKIEGIEFDQAELENIGEDGLKQIKTLSEKAASAGSVTQSFVQEAIQVDNNEDKNISEKAFEYGRYIYCKEVVKEYESRF